MDGLELDPAVLQRRLRHLANAVSRLERFIDIPLEQLEADDGTDWAVLHCCGKLDVPQLRESVCALFTRSERVSSSLPHLPEAPGTTRLVGYPGSPLLSEATRRVHKCLWARPLYC